MRILEIIFLWEGFLALCIFIGIYVKNQWWKAPLSRSVLAIKGGLISLYLPQGIRTITNFHTLRVDDKTLLYSGGFAIMLTYATYAAHVAQRKIVAVRTEVTTATEETSDRWDV